MDEAERRAIAEAEAAELAGASSDSTTSRDGHGRRQRRRCDANNRVSVAGHDHDRSTTPPFRPRIGGVFSCRDAAAMSAMPESLAVVDRRRAGAVLVRRRLQPAGAAALGGAAGLRARSTPRWCASSSSCRARAARPSRRRRPAATPPARRRCRPPRRQLANAAGRHAHAAAGPAGMAALGTALHVLLAAWQRLHPDAVHQLRGRRHAVAAGAAGRPGRPPIAPTRAHRLAGALGRGGDRARPVQPGACRTTTRRSASSRRCWWRGSFGLRPRAAAALTPACRAPPVVTIDRIARPLRLPSAPPHWRRRCGASCS